MRGGEREGLGWEEKDDVRAGMEGLKSMEWPRRMDGPRRKLVDGTR